MLMMASGDCYKCKGRLPFTIQEASVTCKKCGKKFKMCNRCKSEGCPECNGKLESQMEWAHERNIMF